MQFKQYPSYKNSGVEWLGDVPEHWGVNRLGVHFKNRKEKVSDKDFKPLSVTKHGIVPQLEHAAKSDNGDNRKLVRKGDYVINSRSDRKGSSGLADLDGSVSLINIVLTPFKTIHPKFSHYLLRSYLFQEEFYKYGHGIVADLWTTNYEDMRNIHLALPSVSEQTQISNFLEQETTRIDNLIAKQEKLIELLEEQRKSIISHAVTKGLNPNAPMKDSGVEWLGEVPEHWTVLKNRHIFNFSKGLSITKENLQESGIPCVSYGEVHSKFGFEFNPEINDMKFVSEEYLKTSKNCLLNSGDFIFADTSEDFEGSGNFSYLNSNSQVFAGYHTVIARLKSKQKPRFFAYIFDSNAHRKQIQTQVKGIKVFSITQGILKDIYSWLPPVHEQDLIVEYLDNECKKISLLKAKQIELIEKLKAYRSSIISHAVTGKIDVREFGA
jgi:type I restriction enzyme S subunit